MNVQPIEHGADTAAQPQSTKATVTTAQKKRPPMADAARMAAKISRRKSLKKQREAQQFSSIDLAVMNSEFEKWKAECDRLDAALERSTENPDGLTIEESEIAFLELLQKKAEASKRLLKITLALDVNPDRTTEH
jgi:hypothetical protein